MADITTSDAMIMRLEKEIEERNASSRASSPARRTPTATSPTTRRS